MPGGLPPLDFLLMTALVLIVINGGRRGFLKETSMLISVVAGALIARQLAPLLARIIWREGVQPHNALLAYLTVLLVFLLIVTTLAATIRPALNNSALRTIDLVAGLGLGACEGLVFVG